MLGDKLENMKSVRKRWDKRAKRYDEWYKTFKGAVEHYVDWELLKQYLPKQTTAKILDAAGGTGRITLLLAKMGYSVTLCDISSEMLNVAKRKLLKAKIVDRVKILECDVRKLPFSDESFDFVLCWDGMIEAIKELVRVTRRRGSLSVFLVNRCREAIDLFSENPTLALKLMNARSNYIDDDKERYKVTSAEEARNLFKTAGTKVLSTYAVCGWLNKLLVPEKVQESRAWDKRYFDQVAKMALGLAKEPSVQGLSRHLVVYAKIL
jgi:ubiquinone/menaquinone biosynthesis C-methylase UbiE